MPDSGGNGEWLLAGDGGSLWGGESVLDLARGGGQCRGIVRLRMVNFMPCEFHLNFLKNACGDQRGLQQGPAWGHLAPRLGQIAVGTGPAGEGRKDGSLPRQPLIPPSRPKRWQYFWIQTQLHRLWDLGPNDWTSGVLSLPVCRMESIRTRCQKAHGPGSGTWARTNSRVLR